MHSAPIVPGEENRLHGLVVLGALAVPIGQASETPQVHPILLIERFNVRRANLVLIGVAVHSFLLTRWLGKGVGRAL